MNSNQLTPKPGLLVIGRKRPGFDMEWGKQIEAESLDTLNALGLGAVPKARAVDDESLRQALANLRAAGVNTLIVAQPTIGDGRLAPIIGQLWNDPVLLWATPERPGADKATACALVGQHLFASLLRQLGHPFEIVYGPTNDAKTKAALTEGAWLVSAGARIKRAKLGLIGSHVPGFANMHVDPARLSAQLGVELIQFGLHEFIDAAKAMDDSRVKTEVDKVRALKLPADDGITEAEVATDARMYLAMDDLFRAQNLDALAVRCWPELPDVMGQWPYLAFARLASERKPTALEGDADGALCSLISELLGMGPSFITDWLAHDEHTITAWHPGMAPFQLCPAIGTPGGPRLTRHFNNRKPLCVDAELRADMDVTLFRLWSCDGRYHLTAVEARTEKLQQPLAGNSVGLRLDRSVPRWFDDLCHAGMPHHLSIAEGKHVEKLRRFARLMNISFLA